MRYLWIEEQICNIVPNSETHSFHNFLQSLTLRIVKTSKFVQPNTHQGAQSDTDSRRSYWMQVNTTYSWGSQTRSWPHFCQLLCLALHVWIGGHILSTLYHSAAHQYVLPKSKAVISTFQTNSIIRRKQGGNGCSEDCTVPQCQIHFRGPPYIHLLNRQDIHNWSW